MDLRKFPPVHLIVIFHGKRVKRKTNKSNLQDLAEENAKVYLPYKFSNMLWFREEKWELTWKQGDSYEIFQILKK